MTLTVAEASRSSVAVPIDRGGAVSAHLALTVRVDRLPTARLNWRLNLQPLTRRCPDASRTPELNTQFEPVSIVSACVPSHRGTGVRQCQFTVAEVAGSGNRIVFVVERDTELVPEMMFASLSDSTI